MYLLNHIELYPQKPFSAGLLRVEIRRKKKITTGFFFSLQFVYFTFKKIINHEKNNEYFP